MDRKNRKSPQQVSSYSHATNSMHIFSYFISSSNVLFYLFNNNCFICLTGQLSALENLQPVISIVSNK